jgi:hypothetical protein
MEAKARKCTRCSYWTLALWIQLFCFHTLVRPFRQRNSLGKGYAEATGIRRRLAEGVLTSASNTEPTIEDVPIEDQRTERFMSTRPVSHGRPSAPKRNSCTANAHTARGFLIQPTAASSNSERLRLALIRQL